MSVSAPERVPAPAADRAPRGRRLRRAAAIGLIAAVLVGAYLSLPYLVSLGQGVAPRIDGGTSLTVREFGPEGTHFLHYVHGDTITVTVPLTNNGPLPLSVADVRLTEEVSPLLDTLSASADGVSLPVTIGPGETVPVELTARFGNCRYYHERAVQNMPGAIVTGQVLGRSFHEVATFDHPFAVHSQVILDCPDRTLARGDDVRGEAPSPGRGNAGT